jgi:hypothetical protein
MGTHPDDHIDVDANGNVRTNEEALRQCFSLFYMLSDVLKNDLEPDDQGMIQSIAEDIDQALLDIDRHFARLAREADERHAEARSRVNNPSTYTWERGL